jgi:hypothetical protein
VPSFGFCRIFLVKCVEAERKILPESPAIRRACRRRILLGGPSLKNGGKSNQHYAPIALDPALAAAS